MLYEVDAPVRRLATGNCELDDILEGGIPENSINIIMGAPGSGKTTLAEAFMFANANNGRPSLYLTTLSEPVDKVIRYLQQFRFLNRTQLSGSQFAENHIDTPRRFDRRA